MSASPVSVSTAPIRSSVFSRDLSPGAFQKWLVVLALLGLVVRAGYLVEHARSPSYGVLTLDQKYYDTVARMLLAGQDLHRLHGLRPLLYPMFLAGCYRVGGDFGVDLAVVTQHLLGVLTGLLVAMLGARLFRNGWCGVVGGALYLLAPLPLYFEGELLIESSYTFLICAVLVWHFWAAEADDGKGVWLWLVGGALTVLTAQARANFFVFLAVYPVFAGVRWIVSRRLIALTPMVGLAGAALMAVPWGIINERQSPHFQWLPSAGGVNLYLGNKRNADGMVPEQGRRVTYGAAYEDSVEVWAREEYEASLDPAERSANPDPMAISKYWTGRALAEIRADPAAWVHLVAKKIWLTFWNTEVPNNKSLAFLRGEYGWLRWLPVDWAVLLMASPVGIWAAWKWGRRPALGVLLLYAGIYSAANVAFFICDRYRYPVWPAMAVLAGGGWVALGESVRARKMIDAGGMAAAMGLMALISLPNWFEAKLPSFARDYFYRSIACYEKGRFPEALADIDRSLALDPKDASALHHRGNVLFALNDFAEARTAYAQASVLAPEDSAIWNNLGSTLLRLGRTNEAVEAFGRAMSGPSPSGNAFLQMAILRIREGDLEAATGLLDRFDKTQIDPNAAALALRAVMARRRGDGAKAEALEKEARSVDVGAAEWAMKMTEGK